MFLDNVTVIKYLSKFDRDSRTRNGTDLENKGNWLEEVNGF
jgi:hypothetical protein